MSTEGIDADLFLKVDLPFKMDQEQIKKKKAELDEKFLLLRELREQLDLKAKMLRTRCKHPNKYEYTAMGEPGSKCPDCGWSW